MKLKIQTSAIKKNSFTMILLIMLILGTNTLHAQKSEPKYKGHNKRVLNVELIHQNGEKFSGKYLTMNDTIMYLIRPGEQTDSVYKFHYSEIKSVSLNRKGSFKRGFALGMGITSVGSAAIAIASAENSFLGPVGDFLIVEVLLGVPISLVSGLVDAYKGKSIFAPVDGKFSEYQLLNKALEEEDKYATTKTTVVIKDPEILAKTAEKEIQQAEHETTIQDSTSGAKHFYPLVKNKKDLKTPFRFHLKLIGGPKLNTVNSEVINYLENKEYVNTEFDDANMNQWAFDFSVPVKKNIFVGFQYQFHYQYSEISRNRFYYAPENEARTLIGASSSSFIPYVALVNKHINTFNPDGWQLGARAGLIVEKGNYRMYATGVVDGEIIFDENVSSFTQYGKLNLGLQLQATAEYYVFENFSLLAGVSGELKPSIKYESIKFAPSGYDPIVFEEYKLNLSNLYMFGGIGIHF